MRYTHAFTVQASLKEVASFHRDASALRRLTPPLFPLRIHQVEPLAEGSVTEFTLWLGPLPVRWRAQHRDVKPDGFTDEQVKGPFARWVHHHTYRVLDPMTTEVVDEIEAELRAHPLWKVVGWLLWRGLPLLFAYRAWVTRRALQVSRQPSCSLLSLLLALGVVVGFLLQRLSSRRA